MKNNKLIWFIVFAAFVLAVVSVMVETSWGYTVEGPAIPWAYQDETEFTPIVLPEGMILCRYEAIDNQYHCTPVPKGAVLLLPVPQSAPVDSIPENTEGEDE